MERVRNTEPIQTDEMIKSVVRGKDLTGQRFGKLVVLSSTDKRMDSGSIVWRCQCDCGNTAEVSARRLVRGKARSCGCLQKDHSREALKLVDGTSVAILERNRKVRSSNTSGCTGATYDKQTGKWAAYINFKKKRYCLGRYEDKTDAIKVREAAEEIHEDFLDWYYRTYPEQADPGSKPEAFSISPKRNGSTET